MRARPLLALLPALLLLAGCGPDREEIGATALVVVALGNLPLALLMLPLISAWQTVRPELAPRWGLFAVVAVGHAALAWTLGQEGVQILRGAPGLLLHGALWVMPTYLGLGLIAFRLCWAGGWSWGHGLGPLLGSLPIVVPAILMIQGSRAVDDFVVAWLLGGGLLVVGLPILMVEVAIRARRKARAA